MNRSVFPPCSHFWEICLVLLNFRDLLRYHFFNSLEDLGRPSPTVMLRVLPPGLSWARSPWPLWNTTTLAPPPPQPSFFTLNSSLRAREVSQRLSAHARVSAQVQSAWAGRFPSPVIEGDCQFSLGHLLIAFGEQAEELRLKGGLQQAVVIGLMEDEEIILPRTAPHQS